MLLSTIDIINPFWAGCAAIFGYLVGSFPSGLVFTRFAGLGDIRAIGSGNIGATNVLRTGNRKLAALTLLCDVLKGFLSVSAFSFLTGDLGIIAGVFAFLGHVFPIWLGFRGGKGVAIYLGVLAAILWYYAVIFGVIWLAVACASRYSSLSAIVAAMAMPFLAFFLLFPAVSAVLALMSVILVIKHAGNIRRLCKGTESRIGIKPEQNK